MKSLNLPKAVKIDEKPKNNEPLIEELKEDESDKNDENSNIRPVFRDEDDSDEENSEKEEGELAEYRKHRLAEKSRESKTENEHKRDEHISKEKSHGHDDYHRNRHFTLIISKYKNSSKHESDKKSHSSRHGNSGDERKEKRSSNFGTQPGPNFPGFPFYPPPYPYFQGPPPNTQGFPHYPANPCIFKKI